MFTVIDLGVGQAQGVSNALTKCGVDHAVTDDADDIEDATALVLPWTGAVEPALEVMERNGLDEAVKAAALSGRCPLLGMAAGMLLLLERANEETAGLGLLPGAATRFPDDADLYVPHIGFSPIAIVRPHALFAEVPNGAYFRFLHTHRLILPASVGLTPVAPVVDVDSPIARASAGVSAEVATAEHAGSTGARELAIASAGDAGAIADTQPADGASQPAVEATLATCNHGGVFAAVMAKDYAMGVQFELHKSGVRGLRVLFNFARIVNPALADPGLTRRPKRGALTESADFIPFRPAPRTNGNPASARARGDLDPEAG